LAAGENHLPPRYGGVKIFFLAAGQTG
jgi:hypothetical protein